MASIAAQEPVTAPPGVPKAVPLVGAIEVALELVAPSKTNRRTVRNAERDKELIEDIRMHGVTEPIVVRLANPDLVNEEHYKRAGYKNADAVKYVIVAGERRWDLSHKAGKTTIPAIVRNLTNAEALEVQIGENLHREDLDPIDRADHIHDLYQAYLKGMTPKDAMVRLSARLNAKERTLYNMMSLRNLLPQVHKAIRDDKLSMSHGYELAKLSLDTQKEVWTWIEEEMRYGDPVSVRALQQHLAEEVFRRLSGAPWNLDDARLVPAAGACSACTKNSAINPNVAPGEKKATCVDPVCFGKKEQAHLVQLEAEVKKEAEGGKVIRIAGEHLGYNDDPLPKDVIPRDGWKESKPGSCPSTVAAIVATTNAIGQKKYVCTDRNCKKHWKANSGYMGGSASGNDYGLRNKVLTESEKKARLQKVRSKKLDEAYRTAATAAIRKQVTELKTADLQDLALELVERTDRRLRPSICEAMGWKVAKNSYYGPSISPKQIAELKPADLSSLIALLVIADNVLPGLDYYGHSSKVELDSFAKRHKIDLDKIKAQAEAPLRAKFKAIDDRKKAEASTKSTTSTKSTKAKAKKAGKRKAA
jgi:ParB/RepB/Spo0J family partition protein